MIFACDLSDHRYRLRPLGAVRAVDFGQRLTVRPEQPDDHVDAFLLDDHVPVLTGDEGNLISLRFAASQLALDRLSELQHAGICLLRQDARRHWPRCLWETVRSP